VELSASYALRAVKKAVIFDATVRTFRRIPSKSRLFGGIGECCRPFSRQID
jgi:hypothetical protein